MRVLFVTHGVKDTSTAVYRNTLGRAAFLERLGHDTHVVAPADVGLDRWPRLQPVLFPFAVAWRMLERAPYDVVAFHSQTGWVYQLFRPLFKAHRQTHVAVTFHGLDILYVRALAAEGKRRGRPQTLRFRLLHEYVLPRLARWSCRHAARVFHMNGRERRFLLERRWADEERLYWMPNCVQARDFVAHEPSEGPVRLLMLAQWLPVKGTAYMVDAFTALVRSGLDVELTCVGTRQPADAVLRDFAEDVRGRVTVVPQVPHEEVSRFYATADVFVLPSISEGFSIALLEAMAAGLAIVTTDAGAAPDILEPDEAEIVPASNPSALAAAIQRFVADGNRRREFGARARIRARGFMSDEVLRRFADDLLGVGCPVAARAVV